MLGLAVQPPAQARAGVALYPPLVAQLSSETGIFGEFSQIWAVATLLYDSGEVLSDQLIGKVVDSAHLMPEITHSNGSSSDNPADQGRAYFSFPNLVIREPGRYRVRISLMQMDDSCESAPYVRVCEYIDSRIIVVERIVPNHTRPSK